MQKPTNSSDMDNNALSRWSVLRRQEMHEKSSTNLAFKKQELGMDRLHAEFAFFLYIIRWFGLHTGRFATREEYRPRAALPHNRTNTSPSCDLPH